MVKTQRVPLSLNISEHARDALKARAEREGHRYPAAFAAVLLERAIDAPALAPVPAAPSPALGREVEFIAEVEALLSLVGGDAERKGNTVTITIDGPPTVIQWLGPKVRNQAPAGWSVEVKGARKT